MSVSSDYWYWKKKREEEQGITPKSSSGNDVSSDYLYWKQRTQAPQTQAQITLPFAMDVDDIGPVKRTWFDTGAFDDGYQFGDLTKTIFGTTRDVVADVQVGALNLVENAIDTGATLLSNVPGWEDELSAFVAKDIIDEKKIANFTSLTTAAPTQVDVALRLLQGESLKDALLGDSYEENSVLGERSDSLAQSGGQLLTQYALQGVGVPWWVTSAVSSYGSQAEQAFREGATVGEANLSAAISAGAEVLSEMIFGGFKFQGKALSDGVSDIIARGVSNKLLKGLLNFGLDAGGEAIEEVFSSVASRFGQWLTYQDDKTIGEMLASEEAFDEYLESAIGGGVLGGGNTAISIGSNAIAGRDPVSGLNSAEEQVVRDLFDYRVSDAESKGNKLSEFDKNNIWDEVVEQMDRGEIAIDDIERILGGETYKTYQDTVSKHDAIWNEFDTLQSMKRGDMTGKQVEREAELKKIIEEDLAKSPARDDLAKQLRDEVYSVAKDSRLMESYNERVRKSQKYEADVTKYNEGERKIIQKAIDSGILNNARKTHEFVDWVAKVGAAKGIDFDFTNNENLRGTQFEVKSEDGSTRIVNGYRQGSTIGINTDTKKSVNAVVGHEITHVLEGSDLYNVLQDAVFKYAVAKDGQAKFDQRLKEVEKLYEGVSEDAKGELTADLVGEYLFTDKAFIESLTADRNVFQKVFAEIKHMWKLATAGSREKRELERVKKAFEDAYREVGRASNESAKSDVQHSFSEDSEGNQLSPGIARRFENSKVVDENGNLKVVYHGTASGEFSIFDKSKGNVEGDFGSGFYFTDNESDVSEHYEGGGPDFENKVARLAEQIEAEEDIDYSEAEARAREELYKGSHKFEVYLNVENPAIVGETILLDPDEYFSQYSEDDFDSYEDYEAEVEQLVTDAIDNALWEVEQKVDLYSSDGLADVLWSAFSDGGIGIEELKSRINELYLEDSNGNFVGNEVARQIIESLGYDGIIDPTVSGKWNMDIEDGTTHYIAFKPNQIKAVTNQNPTDNPDIHRSLSGENETPIKRGNYHVSAKDIAIDTPYSLDDIAPVAPKNTTNNKIDIAKDSRFVPGTKKKNGAWSWAKEHLLDNGMVFEEYADATGNREIDAKWNFIRNAPAAAQHLIGEGDKEHGVKSLKSIKKAVEKAGKMDAFDDYMLHKHHIDRMTVVQRGLGKSNVGVWGNVTADESRKMVEQYEKNNPEFLEWAKEIYTYNEHLRNKLVEAGIITQNLADKWEQMFPHYVPIRRKGFDEDYGFQMESKDLRFKTPLWRFEGSDRLTESLFDTIGERTLITFKAVAKNNFGVELMNSLGSQIESNESSLDDFTGDFDMDAMFGEHEGVPTYSVFQDGKRVTFGITEEMYEAMKPSESITHKAIPVLSHFNNFFRNVTTQYNPVFALTNAVKDFQDVIINSQHAGKTYANILSGNALAQIAKKGEYYQEYLANGGKTSMFFDEDTRSFKEESMPKKVLDKVFFLNDVIETVPRLAEYIASRDAGKSIEEAMLDSARVTTNFAAGGDWTKFFNRNGCTFLNASVQGALQQVRNVKQAHQKGVMGYVSLLTRCAIGGLVPVILNNLMWDDDEEYEELSDYVKEGYYIVGKYGDGKFIRIPKGRTLSVLQEAIDIVMDTATGDDEVDLARFMALGSLALENLAPNNPIENNIFAPIMQTVYNRTWYGEELVPDRLASLPASEQFDEKTDSISKWLAQTTVGKALNWSPYKINYLLNTYSGGIGDFFLPMITPRSESGDDSLLGKLTAPVRDKFVTDSVLNSQIVTDFYDVCDELERNANSMHATEADAFKYMYIESVCFDTNELYAEKRAIQNSDMSDSEKYHRVREIQEEINAMMEEALNSYQNPQIDGLYAEVGSKRFNFDEESGNWYPIRETNADGSPNYYYEMEQKVTQGLGISYGEYWNNREEYNFAYEKPGQYAVSQAVGGYQDYQTYHSALWDIKADKDENGQSINGTRKRKVVEYINGLDCEYGMKIILYKSEYPNDDEYNYDIIEYLNGRDDISYDQMETILKELGFNVSKDGRITW